MKRVDIMSDMSDTYVSERQLKEEKMSQANYEIERLEAKLAETTASHEVAQLKTRIKELYATIK